MIIKSLTIYFADKGGMKLFKQTKKYYFDKLTLITSEGSNSRGKTTLMRFIIFSLGFDIPLTDGMNSQNYKTEIEFEFNKSNYIIIRENQTYEVYKDNVLIKENQGNYLFKILSVSTVEELDNFLGCFYIDQEKGWTLLNRGRIIGKRSFNIEKFISFLNNLTITNNKIKENERIELENKKIKILEEIKKIKVLEDNQYQEETYSLNEIKELKLKLERLHSKYKSLKYQAHLLTNTMKNYSNFIEQIISYDLKIKIDDKIYPLNHENIIGFNADKEFIQLDIDDIEQEIAMIQKEKESLSNKLEYAQNRISIDGIDNIISKIEISDFNYINILKKKENNSKLKKENTLQIKESLNKNIKEIWDIMKKILQELEVSEEYIEQGIIFRNRLSGISGTQLHKLTFSLKLSLLIYLDKKLNIQLPFIIDSPMSGEVNKETADLMLKLANLNLPKNQIIVSSVYNEYTLNFTKKIILDKTGVIGSLEQFIYTD